MKGGRVIEGEEPSIPLYAAAMVRRQRAIADSMAETPRPSPMVPQWQPHP